jgi:anti-sigma B factor antagonist
VDASDLLAVRRTSVRGTPHLRLIGEVDASTVPILRDAIAEAMRARSGHDVALVLDCTELRFIDGSGLHVVEWAAEVLAPQRVVLHNPPPVMRQLAGIIGLDRRVSLVDTSVSRAS